MTVSAFALHKNFNQEEHTMKEIKTFEIQKELRNKIPEGHFCENGPCSSCKHSVWDHGSLYCNYKRRWVSPNEWHFCCNE